jgi:hypothetical protein
MYIVKPWPELLGELKPQQQVHAAVLADMWQLPVATEAAVAVLKTSADSSTEKGQAVLEGLVSLKAVPDFLMLLFEKPVLSKYGNLEAVWGPAGASLQESLLRLPLPAIEMLLASDKLKVRAWAGTDQLQLLTLLAACAYQLHTHMPHYTSCRATSSVSTVALLHYAAPSAPCELRVYPV